jgi:hypothetical protein
MLQGHAAAATCRFVTITEIFYEKQFLSTLQSLTCWTDFPLSVLPIPNALACIIPTGRLPFVSSTLVLFALYQRLGKYECELQQM